jgi:hypothetical protein
MKNDKPTNFPVYHPSFQFLFFFQNFPNFLKIQIEPTDFISFHKNRPIFIDIVSHGWYADVFVALYSTGRAAAGEIYVERGAHTAGALNEAWRVS